MERFILDKLYQWKESIMRKPLILHEPRRGGKTWVLQEFGRLYYDNVVYVNFEQHEEFKEIFATTKDPKVILPKLMVMTGQDIQPCHTLIIFDEIYFCIKVLL